MRGQFDITHPLSDLTRQFPLAQGQQRSARADAGRIADLMKAFHRQAREHANLHRTGYIDITSKSPGDNDFFDVLSLHPGLLDQDIDPDPYGRFGKLDLVHILARQG